MLKNGPEVNFDKLPLRSMTEMTKYSAQTSHKKVKNIWYLGQENLLSKKSPLYSKYKL